MWELLEQLDNISVCKKHDQKMEVNDKSGGVSALPPFALYGVCISTLLDTSENASKLCGFSVYKIPETIL